MKANAWPLDEQNARRGRVCVGYFAASLPEEVTRTASAAQASKIRRAAAFESQRLLFAEFQADANLGGQVWEDADGVSRSVHIRVQNLIVDYVDCALSARVDHRARPAALPAPVSSCPPGPALPALRPDRLQLRSRASERDASEPDRPGH